MWIQNDGTTKSFIPMGYAYCPDPEPKMPKGGAAIAPGEQWGVGSGAVYCFVFHQQYPPGVPEVPFWKGRVYPEEIILVNPDTEEVSIGSKVLQSNVNGKMYAQITNGPTFTYSAGNRAALAGTSEIRVEASTPYVIFEIHPPSGSSFGVFSGITVTGPGLTVSQPTNNNNVIAYSDGVEHLVSVLVANPAAGTWTATVNSGDPGNGDYVLLGIAGPSHVSYKGIEAAIESATPVCADVVDSLIPDEDGQSIKSKGMTIRSGGMAMERTPLPGACALCIVTWMIPVAVIGAYTGVQLKAAVVASPVVLKVMVLTGLAAEVVLQLVHEAGVELNPLKWPRMFCRYMGECT